jgi:transposase-like protein
MAFEMKGMAAAASEQAPPDLLRSMLAQMMQAAIQAEFDRFMGAGPWERTGERRGWRNGSKGRRLHTRVGTIELRIPKDREGRFQPSLFERYQRSEKAFVLAPVEMYIQGVSTRKVQKVVEQLCGVLVSASQVSALVKGLDGELETWRRRSLGGQKYPYLVVDAHYEKVRREGRVLSTAVLWVIGISETGYREHLGVWTGPSESRESWVRVFRDLTQRGLEGVEYVVSDEHAGLVQALGLYFPEADHQRCQVHYNEERALVREHRRAARGADHRVARRVGGTHPRRGTGPAGTARGHPAREGACARRVAGGDGGADARVLRAAGRRAPPASAQHQQRRA